MNSEYALSVLRWRNTGALVATGFVAAALVACESKPSKPARVASKAPVVSAEAPEPPQPTSATAAMAITRWRGTQTCLELFANGDAEITLHGRQPKVLVMGRASIDASTPGAFTVAVSAIKIWKGRFLGPCRKVHETGTFTDTASVLGTTLEADEGGSFTMKKLSEEAWEMCGATCETLKPDAPLLGANWRRPNPDAADPQSQYAKGSSYSGALGESWTTGELLEIKLIEGRQHLWFGGADNKRIEISATMSITALENDQFRIAIPIEETDAAAGADVLGLPVQRGQPLILRARRLINQQLEVCGKEQQCQVLDRLFDSYDYGVR